MNWRNIIGPVLIFVAVVVYAYVALALGAVFLDSDLSDMHWGDEAAFVIIMTFIAFLATLVLLGGVSLIRRGKNIS